MDSESENQNKLFSNLQFSLINYSKDLTEKRAEIIKDIIKCNGGSVLQTNYSKLFSIIFSLITLILIKSHFTKKHFKQINKIK